MDAEPKDHPSTSRRGIAWIPIKTRERHGRIPVRTVFLRAPKRGSPRLRANHRFFWYPEVSDNIAYRPLRDLLPVHVPDNKTTSVPPGINGGNHCQFIEPIFIPDTNICIIR
jgi:hypothetical protein